MGLFVFFLFPRSTDGVAMVVSFGWVLSKANHERATVIVACHVVDLFHSSAASILGTHAACLHTFIQIRPQHEDGGSIHGIPIRRPIHRETVTKWGDPAEAKEWLICIERTPIVQHECVLMVSAPASVCIFDNLQAWQM
jgi:hypothetical protein